MRRSIVATRPQTRRRISFVACTVGLLCATTIGLGQQPAATAKKVDAPGGRETQHQFHVYWLKHVSAAECENLIRGALGEDTSRVSTITPDRRTNTLIVSATPEGLEFIRQLLEKLDVPETNESAESLRLVVFRVSHVALDPALQKQLQLALSERGRMAIDPNRNAVVVYDTPDGLKSFETLLKVLDRPNEATPLSQGRSRIRVVWLISGMPGQDLPSPPADLKGVTDDLAQISVDGLQVAAQTLVQAVADNRFLVQCSPVLRNPCELSISGTLGQVSGDEHSLRLEIRASEQVPGEKPRALCSLSTTILAPPGRTVVLGATPLGKMTSVFVVQVTPE